MAFILYIPVALVHVPDSDQIHYISISVIHVIRQGEIEIMKRILLVICAAVLCAIGSSSFSGQAAYAADTWVKEYRASRTIWGRGMTRASDGGYIVTGHIDNRTGTEYNFDAFVMRVNARGEIIWRTMLGSSASDWAHAVAETPDGGVLVTGEWNYGAWPYHTTLWLFKLSSSGTLLWQRNYGIAGREFTGKSMQVTSDGGFIVLAEYVYNAYISTSSQYDMLLLKFDQDGDLEWQRSFDHSQFDQAVSVIRTADGGYAVAGRVRHAGDDKIWLIKLAADGDPVWQKLYDHGTTVYGQTDAVTGMQQTADGGYILTAYARELLPYSNYWLVLKLDAGGNVSWQRRINLEHHPNMPLSVVQTGDGGYVVNGGSSVPYLVKLSADGNVLWGRRVGLVTGEYSFDFQLQADGGYLMPTNYLNGIRLTRLDADGSIRGDQYPCRYLSSPLSVPTADCTFTAAEIAVVPGDVSLVRADEAPILTELSVSETNVCVSAAPDILISPLSLAFGAVELFGTSTQVVTVSNRSAAPLSIGAPAIDGMDAGSFSQANDCSTVAGYASCSIAVTFSPFSLGSKTASLSIRSDDPDTPVAAVSLSGTGVDTVPPETVISTAGVKGINDWYVSEVLVSLKAADLGSGVREVHCSIDGREAVVPSASASFPIAGDGQHAVAYYAVDQAGNKEAEHSLVLRIDTTPPLLEAKVSPGLLWPPNHKMVTVLPAVAVSDPASGVVSASLVSVTSSEPDDGAGDGNTGGDIKVNGDGSVSLRAERSASGNGRVYTLLYQAEDAAGNTATSSAEVLVPHARESFGGSIDSGSADPTLTH